MEVSSPEKKGGKNPKAKPKREKFQLSKKCVASSIACVSVAIVLVVTVNSLLKKPTKKGGSSSKESYLLSADLEDVCSTDECKVAGDYFKKNMNLSADPCNDFYNYVCGRWPENNMEHLNMSKWTVDHRQKYLLTEKIVGLLSSKGHNDSGVVDRAKHFFQKCVATDFSKEQEGVKKIVKHFGGFPLYDDETYDRNVHWFQRTARVIRHFGIYDYVNGGFTQAVILNAVFHPILSLIIEKPTSYYREPSFYNRTSYKNLVRSSMCTVIKTSCTAKDMQSIENQVEKLVLFQGKMADIVLNAEESGDEMKVLDFTKKFPNLNLYEFLRELFTDSGHKITDNTLLHVKSLTYWENVNQLLKSTDAQTIDNLIGWSNMEVLQYTTSPMMILNAYKYLRVRNNEGKLQNNTCFVYTDVVFKFAVSRLFIDHLFTEDARQLATKTVKLMQKAFITMMQSKKWLDESTKKEAIKKISLMELNIGYPNWLKNDAILEKYYSLPDPTPSLSLIETLEKFITFNNAQTLLKRHHPLSENIAWESIAPHVSNAQYTPYKNTLVLPSTQCIPPLLWSNATKALLFSSASATIGHEMAHSVDVYGSKFDAYGNKRNWWDDDSKRKFVEVSDCLKKQYSGTLDPLSDKHLRGESTIGEDIADIVGLRLAYKAYLLSGGEDKRLPGLEHLSGRKLFFIGAGMFWCAHYTLEGMEDTILRDNHSPNNYRVFIPSSNLIEFAKAFRCSFGSQMNRKDKCVVW